MSGTLQAPPGAKAALNKRFPGAAPQVELPEASLRGNPLVGPPTAPMPAAPPAAMLGNPLAPSQPASGGGAYPGSPPAAQQLAPAAPPQAQPSSDAALQQAAHMLATGPHSDADLAEHADMHSQALGHLSALLAKGDKITRSDAAQGVLDAAKAGTITDQQASGLLDRLQGSPQQIQNTVRGLMAQATLGAVATAAAQQRRAAIAPSASPPSAAQPAGAPA